MPYVKRLERKYRTLSAWRRATGLNQRQAAYVLGVSQSTYGRLERGLRTATRGRAKRIMRLTGVPLESLTGVSRKQAGLRAIAEAAHASGLRKTRGSDKVCYAEQVESDSKSSSDSALTAQSTTDLPAPHELSSLHLPSVPAWELSQQSGSEAKR